MRNTRINMNGNRYEDIATELENAREAASALKEAIGNLTVHGRNYVPQGMGEGWEADRQEKAELYGMADDILDRLYSITIDFQRRNKPL